MFSLTHFEIKSAELNNQFNHPDCGAFVCFEGVVRNHHQGRAVSHLFYDAYPEMAKNIGQNIVKTAVDTYAIQHAYCIHRLGKLEIGDIAVWVGVNSAHRDAAFDACRFIIDNIKKDVPIWKKEFYLDNESIWLHPSNL